MDSSTGRAALISLHPEFAERILSGSKRVEFRRTRFSCPVETVVIYATAPIQRVVGFFDVETFDADRPAALWRRYGAVAGIDARRFAEYFAGRDTGYAICVARAYALKTPLDLGEFMGIERPPQSFQYIGRSVVGSLRSHPCVRQRAAS